MRNIAFYLMLFLLAGYISSCTSKADEAKIQSIDTLLKTLNDAEEMLLSVDAQKVDKKLAEINETADFLNTHLRDTIDKETAIEVSEYLRYKKALRFYKENYPEFIEAVNTSRKQLSDLKTDVENGVLDNEKFNEYYNNEMRIVLDISQNIDRAVNGVNLALNKIEEKRPVIEKVIEHIKQSDKQ
jgi:ElaB/YqjD/DUF883 family membrane-anchored ribosome-binding protein/regulator of replication initiation timing